jgi:hypothetical protein
MESYRLGERQVSHRKWYVLVPVILVALVAGGIVAGDHFLKANTSLGPAPPPVTTHITAADGATKRFDEGTFTISLPADWKFVSHQTAVYNIYTWHNTKVNPGVEQLQVYLDTIPTTLGVNRVLPVQAAGDHVVPTSVSDTCADFTGDKVPGSERTPAKWENVNFLCDLANYERDVVGTSSAQGVNLVKLTGATTGRHNFFFTYTDNGPTPNFTIFTDALQSFRLQ